MLKVGDELAQLDVGDLALADLAGEVDVLQHVVQAGVVVFNPGERLVQQSPTFGARVVDQVL
jgi:hypothetical protein